MKDVVVGILAIRNIHIKGECPTARSGTAKFEHLVIVKGEVSGHIAVNLVEDTVGYPTNVSIPCRPWITIGLSDFSTGHIVAEIIAQLSESIAKNEGNHRNE